VDAVRKRVKRGTLESEKEADGRVYVFLDTDQESDYPRSDSERLISTLEEQLRLEREAHAEARRLLAAALERIPAIEPPPEGGSEPVPDTPAPPEPETPRVVASSVPHSRLGMSAWALAVGAIATLLTWVNALVGIYGGLLLAVSFSGEQSLIGIYLPLLLLPMLVPLLSGLWAGTTKHPSLPWFSSPRRWLRRGGRSVLEIATFTTGMPALVASLVVFVSVLATGGVTVPSWTGFVFGAFVSLAAVNVASVAFMSGAFLGNAQRRVGLLGTPKEPLQGEEEGEHEEEVWSPRKEARWGLVGSIIVALISAVASVLAASINQ